jgi:dihydropteroate synthase
VTAPSDPLAPVSSLQRPILLGVVNLTPDSFSDGGDTLAPRAALERCEALLRDGADLLDLGAESTRPGATPLSAAEEWARLEPVLTTLARRHLTARVSLDTRKPEIMRRGADLGITLINDVEGGRDSATLKALARYVNLGYLAMHMHGTPENMQRQPLGSRTAVAAADAFFAEREDALRDAGFSPARIWLDPGIGFGKTDAANLRLMAEIPRWRAAHQVAVGVSRKGFLGRALGLAVPKDRDPPTKTLELGLWLLGARMIRTHDVARLRTLIDLALEDDA